MLQRFALLAMNLCYLMPTLSRCTALSHPLSRIKRVHIPSFELVWLDPRLRKYEKAQTNVAPPRFGIPIKKGKKYR